MGTRIENRTNRENDPGHGSADSQATARLPNPFSAGRSDAIALFNDMTPQIGASQRVFVVEDDPLICADIECTLSECGFDVLGRAECLSDAMDFVTSHHLRLDCVLLDIELGGQSCLRLTETLDRFGISYLLVTGHSEDVVRDLGFRAQVVEKPFQNYDLEARLSDLLV